MILKRNAERNNDDELPGVDCHGENDEGISFSGIYDDDGDDDALEDDSHDKDADVEL